MVKRLSKVMLIDDELLDQKIYQRVLKRSGIVDEIITFQYADEALEYLKSIEPKSIDVIFLDINMPRMNGFEFLESATDEIGEEFAGAVIVMLTTSLNPADQERAMSFEVVRDFINKPLTEEHVLGVSNMLAS